MARNPHAVDIHVGTKIRQRRMLLGMSQSALGEAAGITFQQIQKYENGSNRCSASMLWQFSQALDVEPGFFFEDLPVDRKNRPKAPADVPDPLTRRETLELARNYHAIGKPAQRAAVRELVKSLGQAA